MAYLIALLIFGALSAACWFGAVHALGQLRGDTGLKAKPDYSTVAAVAIAAQTMMCFVPFPGGLYLGLAVWGIAVFASLEMGAKDGTILWGLLTAASLIQRVLITGVLEMLPK